MIKLTDEQKEKYKTIQWLVNDGPYRTGKTTLLALAFLEKAEHYQGENVTIWDHLGAKGRPLDFIKSAIYNIWKQKHNKQWPLEIIYGPDWIRIEPR